MCSVEYPVSELEAEGGLKAQLNPLLERMPKSAWFMRQAVAGYLENWVVAAQLDFTDADQAAEWAKVIVAETKWPKRHFELL